MLKGSAEKKRNEKLKYVKKRNCGFVEKREETLMAGVIVIYS